ncbi:hypothetical protein SLEP1_g10239 [Rubroshorea leprosula]|uniref:Uncharacterized protein n=1 Tax=Rubroshorea leprosula TaxID=152421 RepID=A0AAV5IHD8_9ROSI|nr:hypothetical protein SLEP1_g10239 [Rubroshorea leprosula]
MCVAGRYQQHWPDFQPRSSLYYVFLKAIPSPNIPSLLLEGFGEGGIWGEVAGFSLGSLSGIGAPPFLLSSYPYLSLLDLSSTFVDCCVWNTEGFDHSSGLGFSYSTSRNLNLAYLLRWDFNGSQIQQSYFFLISNQAIDYGGQGMLWVKPVTVCTGRMILKPAKGL